MAITLGSIKTNQPKPPRVIIHGERGIGKTTFGVSAPNPIFILTEDGLGKNIVKSFPLAKSYQDVLDAITCLYTEDHNYETLVIDSLDWLEPLIWQHVCETWTTPKGELKRLQSIEDAGYGKGYVEAVGYWKQFFDGLDALRDAKNMNIIMIAHTAKVKVEDPLYPAYDTNAIKLHRRAASIAEEYADVILYAQLQTTMTVDSKDKKERSRAISNGSRILHTVGHPAYSAKNRYSMPSPIPFPKDNAWDVFVSYMSEGENE